MHASGRGRFARWVGQAAVVAVTVAAPMAAGAGESDDEPRPKSCAHVKAISFPASDQPDAATAAALKGCDSEALFYGIGQPPDAVKARLCAYVERAGGDEAVFGGSAMLMTIYASGIGAEQNVSLAIQLACALEGAEGELFGRVAHLEKIKRTHPKKVTFGLCDDVTSGFMEGHCAAHAYRIKNAKREQRLTALVASWSPEEREGWQSLRQRAAAFIDARSANEVDLSGTARGALQVEEQEVPEKEFDELLRKLGQGGLPRATPAAFARADAALNATYKQIMAGPAPEASSGMTKDGIRMVERAWLPYRDAWVAFTKLKFPNVNPLSTKLWLTRSRAAMLAGLVPDEPASPAEPGPADEGAKTP